MRFAHIVAVAALVCMASESPAATQTSAGTSDEAQIRQLIAKQVVDIPRTKDLSTGPVRVLARKSALPTPRNQHPRRFNSVFQVRSNR